MCIFVECICINVLQKIYTNIINIIRTDSYIIITKKKNISILPGREYFICALIELYVFKCIFCERYIKITNYNYIEFGSSKCVLTIFFIIICVYLTQGEKVL